MLGGYCTGKLYTVFSYTSWVKLSKGLTLRLLGVILPLIGYAIMPWHMCKLGEFWGQPMGRETPHRFLGPCQLIILGKSARCNRGRRGAKSLSRKFQADLLPLFHRVGSFRWTLRMRLSPPSTLLSFQITNHSTSWCFVDSFFSHK